MKSHSGPNIHRPIVATGSASDELSSAFWRRFGRRAWGIPRGSAGAAQRPPPDGRIIKRRKLLQNIGDH